MAILIENGEIRPEAVDFLNRLFRRDIVAVKYTRWGESVGAIPIRTDHRNGAEEIGCPEIKSLWGEITFAVHEAGTLTVYNNKFALCDTSAMCQYVEEVSGNRFRRNELQKLTVARLQMCQVAAPLFTAWLTVNNLSPKFLWTTALDPSYGYVEFAGQ